MCCCLIHCCGRGPAPAVARWLPARVMMLCGPSCLVCSCFSDFPPGSSKKAGCLRPCPQTCALRCWMCQGRGVWRRRKQREAEPERVKQAKQRENKQREKPSRGESEISSQRRKTVALLAVAEKGRNLPKKCQRPSRSRH